MASPRLVALPLLGLLWLAPPSAHAQVHAPQGPAAVEVSLYAEASRHLGGGARVDYTLGQAGPGRLGFGAELGGGHCARHCLRIYTPVDRPETGQLEPGQRPVGVLERRTTTAVLLPSLRASYHLDFRRPGLLSLTDVYGLVLLGAAGARATFSDGGQAPTAHSSWTPALGFGAGVRQLFGQRLFVAGELRVRMGSGTFGTGLFEQQWRVSGPGLTLAAGLHL